MIVTGAIALLLLAQAWATKLTPYDDALWLRRAQAPLGDYELAVDVPGGIRAYYRTILSFIEWRGASIATDYELSPPQNHAHGASAPADAVLAMRTGNVAAFIAGLLCLYYVAVTALGSSWRAALALSPLLISPLFPVHIIPRVGPDALLFAWVCGFLALWIYTYQKGRASSWQWALVLGAVGGLASFVKINGALVLFAYMAWLAASNKGRARLLLPPLAGAAGFVVFYLLNPAFHGAGPTFVVWDILARRVFVAQGQRAIYGPIGWLRLVHRVVPCWPLLPLVATVVCRGRRAWWFWPVVSWGLALVVGTLATINQPLPRYVGPLELGLYFPVALVCLSINTRAGQKE